MTQIHNKQRKEKKENERKSKNGQQFQHLSSHLAAIRYIFRHPSSDFTIRIFSPPATTGKKKNTTQQITTMFIIHNDK